MSDLVEISKLNIGDSVKFSYDEYGAVHKDDRYSSHIGTIIAIYNEDRCIGWKNPEHNQIVTLHAMNKSSRKRFLESDCLVMNESDMLEHKYCMWVGARTIVQHLVDAVILFPDQKCAGCDLPAPHVAPNDGNNFVCSSCKFLATL